MKRLMLCSICLVMTGCGSGVRTMQPASEPPKGSFTQVIKDDPNIPASAKKAMLGNQAPVGATK